MEEIILLLYFKEEVYGRRFLRFLAGKKNPRVHPELVTEKERLLQRIGTSAQRIVIVTDNPDVCEDGKREVILLAGEQNRREKKIFQFQCAEEIYEQLLALLGIEKEESLELTEKEDAQGVIMLFSPEGGGSTELAVLLSQYLGQRGKCLYISLSGFPIFYGSDFEKSPEFFIPGLGEMLLCTGEELFADKLRKVVQSFGSADILAPLPHFRDLLDCTSEDWKQLLKRLRTEGGYDSVVVEVGLLFEALMDFLELGDRVWILTQEDAFGKVREKIFCRYCQMEKRERLLEKMEIIPVPEEAGEWRDTLSRQRIAEWAADTRVMQQMQDLVRGRKGEDDVCLWEDF